MNNDNNVVTVLLVLVFFVSYVVYVVSSTPESNTVHSVCEYTKSDVVRIKNRCELFTPSK